VVDKAENTKRLAKNTLLLYVRSLFNLLVSLYTSRLILQALGVDDYGINNAVAGFASMFWLVTGSLSSATSRFLTFELGKGNKERLGQIFSLSLNIMIGFAILVLILSQTIGIWFVQNKMVIPPGRERAAIVVFELAIVTVVSGFIVSPFNSAIIAHEKMGLYAIVGICETVLKLAIAIFLTYGEYKADVLILYAALWMLSTLLIQSVAIVYTSIHFGECRPRAYFDRKSFLELFGFAGWNFLGSMSGTFSNQGVNMLINIFYGPAVNAARGLTSTVRNAVSIFVNNFTLALTPQITKAYAAEDIDYMNSLVYRGSKFSFYIMFFISLPLILETKYVLSLWLTMVPEHTVEFVRLAQVVSLTDLLYVIFANVQNATGNIRDYKIIMSILTFLNFVLSWFFLKIGFKIEVIYFVAIAVSLMQAIVTLKIVKPTMKFSFKELLEKVYIPELLVVLCSSIFPALLYLSLPYGWKRFLIVGLVSVVCSSFSILFIGATKGERAYVLSEVKSKLGFTA